MSELTNQDLLMLTAPSPAVSKEVLEATLSQLKADNLKTVGTTTIQQGGPKAMKLEAVITNIGDGVKTGTAFNRLKKARQQITCAIEEATDQSLIKDLKDLQAMVSMVMTEVEDGGYAK